MNLLNGPYKRRYAIFIITVILTIVANELILRYNLNLQDSDARIINIAGRQRMLSQKISKHLLFLGNDAYTIDGKYTLDSLAVLVNEFESAHRLISPSHTKEETSASIDSLFQVTTTSLRQMVNASKAVLRSNDSTTLKKSIKTIALVENLFLHNMESIVAWYQRNAERKLNGTKRVALVLSIVSILVLLGEFLFIIMPFFNDLFNKNKELATANRRLSDFANITSHNLRAPISNLNSLLHFMEQSDEEEEKKMLMGKFKTVLGHLNDTMNVLVEAIKTQSSSTRTIEELSFTEVLTKTEDTIYSQIKESGAIIKSNFFEIDNVHYDRLYLESIFLNLLTNSLKYKSTDRTPEIYITSKRTNGKILLSFKDNGLGINMKRNKDKIFGLNKVFHKHPDAKGVGLFMTRTQIESLGGTIAVESEVGKGTTFNITFK